MAVSWAKIGGLALAAAVLGTTAASAADPPKELKLYVFSSGALNLDKSIIQNGSSGKVQIPVGFFLIRQPKGDVLFDCGNNDKIITDPYYWGPFVKALDPGRSPDIAIDAQLAKINVKPADIKYVVLGHFHVDHAGKIGKFLDSRDAEGADIIYAHEPSKLTSTRPNLTSERMPRSLRPTPQTRAS
jgi:N-acyl homoserine lactone hydrolase